VDARDSGSHERLMWLRERGCAGGGKNRCAIERGISFDYPRDDCCAANLCGRD